MVHTEQTPQEHAMGVASEQPTYLMGGKIVYIAYSRRCRHQNHAWGYFTQVAYRGVFEAFERSMPMGKFLGAAEKTGRTVREQVELTEGR
jgi:hypothetical protein